jgi:hypothetical protein
MAGWAAYGTVAAAPGSVPSTPGAVVPAAGQARCAECGQVFPVEDMVRFEQSYVCASCKPVFFQKIREGVPAGGGGAGMWRYKKQLVTMLDPVLPARCVKCNAPSEAPQKKRKLYWHSPAVYVALLVNVIVYVIIAVITRKRSTAMVTICGLHAAKRRNAIITAWALVVAGIGLFVTGLANDVGWLAGLGPVLLLVGIIYGIVKGRLVYATKIDKEHLWLGGCGKDFLSQFPEWTGA